MSQTSQDEKTGDPVQAVAADFEACSRRAIECLLNRPTLLSKSFCAQSQIPAEPGIRCIIESANGDHSLVISLGLSKTDLESLFAGEEDEDLKLDAIGEMVNVISGSLFGRPGFHSRFGCMRASIPTFAPPSLEMGQARTIRGVLFVGTAHLFLELAIHSGTRGGNL